MVSIIGIVVIYATVIMAQVVPPQLGSLGNPWNFQPPPGPWTPPAFGGWGSGPFPWGLGAGNLGAGPESWMKPVQIPQAQAVAVNRRIPQWIQATPWMPQWPSFPTVYVALVPPTPPQGSYSGPPAQPQSSQAPRPSPWWFQASAANAPPTAVFAPWGSPAVPAPWGPPAPPAAAPEPWGPPVPPAAVPGPWGPPVPPAAAPAYWGPPNQPLPPGGWGSGPWMPQMINPWMQPAPWTPQWTACSNVGSVCLDCNTRFVCTKMGGLERACANTDLPYCNAGACSSTPTKECEP